MCTHDKECLFGSIVNGGISLSGFGEIVKRLWASLPEYYKIDLDEYVVMPNHVHGIIIIHYHNT